MSYNDYKTSQKLAYKVYKKFYNSIIKGQVIEPQT